MTGKTEIVPGHLEDNMSPPLPLSTPRPSLTGNRIHTAENSNICRDSEGRTRREASLNLLGAGPQASAPKLITILDPVAGVRYMLDSENKVAHKMTLPPPGSAQKSRIFTR